MGNGGVLAIVGSVIVGILTTGITLVVSLLLSDQSRSTEELRIAQNKAALFDLDLERRLGMTGILRNVLAEGTSPEELLEQKLRYDESYLRWNENTYLHGQAAGVILSRPEHKDYLDLLEKRLVFCTLRPIDAYITKWYRCRANAKDVAPSECAQPAQTPTCGRQSVTFESLRSKARECGKALADFLSLRSVERQRAIGSVGYIWRGAEQPQSPEAAQAWSDAKTSCSLGKRDPLLSGLVDPAFTNLGFDDDGALPSQVVDPKGEGHVRED
jgi:hypothetical protein